jgi:hypothetical protein
MAFMTACPKTRTSMPAPIRDTLIEGRLGRLKDLADKYDAAIDSGVPDPGRAKLYRNELIYQAKQLMDANYNDFENDLFVRRASSNVLMDITELGVSVATGITNGERVKSILGVAQTAFKGGRRSVDLNFFRERTTEVLALKMRAARARVLQRINLGVRAEVADYPLASGLDDLIDYLNAGSLNSALLELTGDTGAEAQEARRVAGEIKITSFLTGAQAAALGTIRANFNKIAANLRNPATAAKGERQLNAVLIELGVPSAEVQSASLAARGKLFEDKFEAAGRNSDQAALEKIRAALDKALADPAPTPSPSPSPSPAPAPSPAPSPSPTPPGGA